MTEKEIRELIERLKEHDVLVSIPEVAGFFGDIEAISMFPAIKEKMMEATIPLRTMCSAGHCIKAFVYGETSKMKANPEYLEKFVEMSQQFGKVSDICGMKYNL